MAFGADSEEKCLSKERIQESNVICCPNNRFDHLTQRSFVHFCRVVLDIRSVHREPAIQIPDAMSVWTGVKVETQMIPD
jgi:hypothetical protein